MPDPRHPWPSCTPQHLQTRLDNLPPRPSFLQLLMALTYFIVAVELFSAYPPPNTTQPELIKLSFSSLGRQTRGQRHTPLPNRRAATTPARKSPRPVCRSWRCPSARAPSPRREALPGHSPSRQSVLVQCEQGYPASHPWRHWHTSAPP